ncbi:MAG: DUF4835 domain-containing protein [Thalassobius sp.]|nr:DUF4835 domain-containing protein [Thalassovita sp.]
MNSVKFRIVLSLFVFNAFIVSAQELQCNVEINSERVQTQQTQIFEDMQNAITEFMNTTKWTDDEYEENEKIKCNLLIILGSNSTVNTFEANVQIQSSRPVFGTDYETPLINFLDNKWGFAYTVSQPLIFAENTYNSELTSLLAFYAYIIIGLDYDSFEKQGGTPYFNIARNIASLAEQQGGGTGWTSLSDTRDRYWVSENLNNAQFVDFRDAIYDYHRLGLDVFNEDPDGSREVIMGSLEKVAKVREVSPTSIMVNTFFDTKDSELVNIFSRGDMQLREQAIELLTKIDPTNSNDYKKALKQ